MTKIEWTDETWNPVIGCTPVSPGCLNCYAAAMAWRLAHNPKTCDYEPRIEILAKSTPYGVFTPARSVRIAEVRGDRAVFTGDVRTLAGRLEEPLRWRKPRRVFVNSMSDLFHEAVPFEFVDQVFAVMALCPQHTFQVLTKRPERMAEYLTRPDPNGVFESAAQAGMRQHVADLGGARWTERYPSETWPLPNVWLGTSVEDQARADERIPHLLRCPAAVRFLSCEPLLASLDLHDMLRRWVCSYCGSHYAEYINGCPRCHFGESGTGSSVRLNRIDWVIVGGESGPHSRPCDIEWIRSIVAQCKNAGVPVFVKQVGTRAFADIYAPDPETVNIYDTPRPTHRAHFTGRDRKGGDPAEWPADLRVREMPEVRS